MANLVNHILRVTLSDTRSLTGQLMAFDKHMNLVLADCEEFRRLKSKTMTGAQAEQRRSLGLVILRGETIVSLTVMGPPPTRPEDRARVAMLQPGPGMGRAIGRGLPVVPAMAAPSLAGPVRGIGGPSAPSMMMPPPPPSALPGGAAGYLGRALPLLPPPPPPMGPEAVGFKGMPPPPPPPPVGFMGRGGPPPPPMTTMMPGRGQPPSNP